MVKFCAFTHMPWRHLPGPLQKWPAPSAAFVPDAGRDELKQFIGHLILADALKFDWMGVGEEHSNPFGLVPNTALVGAILAANTNHSKIALLGAPLPLLNPIRVAEEYAWVDVLSGGRLVAGLLRGVPQNYAAYNVDPSESWSRFSDGLDCVIRAWSDHTPFSFSSKHYNYDSVSIWPRPFQDPHPPLLMSCGSAASAKMAAKHRSMVGQIHLAALDGLDAARKSFDYYEAECLAHGWVATPNDLLLGLYTVVAETDQEARELMEPCLDYLFHTISGGFQAEKIRIFGETNYLGVEPGNRKAVTVANTAKIDLESRINAGIVLCGSPKTVIEQIQNVLEKTRVGNLSIHFSVGNLPHPMIRDSVSLFGTKVLPAFRRRG